MRDELDFALCGKGFTVCGGITPSGSVKHRLQVRDGKGRVLADPEGATGIDGILGGHTCGLDQRMKRGAFLIGRADQTFCVVVGNLEHRNARFLDDVGGVAEKLLLSLLDCLGIACDNRFLKHIM